MRRPLHHQKFFKAHLIDEQLNGGYTNVYGNNYDINGEINDAQVLYNALYSYGVGRTNDGYSYTESAMSSAYKIYLYQKTFAALTKYFSFEHESHNYYRGYKYKITLEGENGVKQAINAIGFDAKAATADSKSWLFPFDAADVNNPLHDHVLEFVFDSFETKKQKAQEKGEQSVLTNGIIGNVDLAKLLGDSENGPYKVRSISAYIEKPYIGGQWGSFGTIYD